MNGKVVVDEIPVGIILTVSRKCVVTCFASLIDNLCVNESLTGITDKPDGEQMTGDTQE